MLKENPLLPKMDHLTLNSTLQELTLFDFSIESSHPGKEVIQALEANPLLPGFILTEQGQFLGMISRRRFLEYMSRPYGLELFLNRPLKSLYLLARTDTLIFLSTTLIVDAAKISLQRSAESVYEPIVVKLDSVKDSQEKVSSLYRLLDVHQLLIAQSQIHELASDLIKNLYKELKISNIKLQKLATIDQLTQLPNRRRFDNYITQQWHQMKREQFPLSLIMGDVDFFKLYNDTYGHQAGDYCLQKVGKAIKISVNRVTDLVARYGGEEFAVILPNTHAKGAIYLAKRILINVRQLQMPHEKSTISDRVTISLGVATLIPTNEATPDNLIALADAALYQAKSSGRNRFALDTSLIKVKVSQA